MLSTSEKTKLQREGLGIKKQLRSGELSSREKMPLQRRWAVILKALKGGEEQPKVSLVDRFVAGEFKALPLDQFFAKIDEVDSAGGTIEQLRFGSVDWVYENAALLGLSNA
jgi:hypothetical protein